MDIEIMPGKVSGSVSAPPSKSMMQRAIAASLLAQGRSRISNPSFSDDCIAAMAAAEALGAKVERGKKAVVVEGAGKGISGKKGIRIDCNESGLCIRLFAPISALCRGPVELAGKGSLMDRPVGMVEKPLKGLGAGCNTNGGRPPVRITGPISGGSVEVDGSESSQFLSGLLMALPMCKKDSRITVKGLESRPYVRMTLEVLKEFGIKAQANGELSEFAVPGRQSYAAGKYEVEGDWSGASCILVAGAIAGKAEVRGLKPDSQQADIKMLEALKIAGAKVAVGRGAIISSHAPLSSFEFDATDCPDLFPALAALACNCRGKSRIMGAGRLMHKESNRASVLATEFGKMGCKVRVSGGVMEIEGGKLSGAAVDSHGDHRIAMACAAAALCAEGETTIKNAGCVSKSYPNFFSDLEKLRVK